MNMDLSSLGDDRNISKKDVLLLLQNQQEYFQIQEEKYQSRIDYLEEQLRLLRNELFGRKSEKPPRQDQDQIPLFGEPEQQKEADSSEQEEKTVDIPAHRRKKGGRKPLPEHLPRVEVIHDISDEEKMCACGHMMSCFRPGDMRKARLHPAPKSG